MTHVRLLTTEMLTESRALYAADGYVEIGRTEPERRAGRDLAREGSCDPAHS